MKNFNEKIVLAKSAGQYSNNGYPIIFELYYYPDNNDDLLYLDIYPDETQQDFFSELYEETLQDCLKYNNHQLKYKTVVSITEISEDEAKQFFDWNAIINAPVFK